MVVLEQRQTGGGGDTKASYRVVALAAVQKVAVTAAPPALPPNAPALASLPDVDLDVVRTREKRVVDARKEANNFINVKATMRAQQIFDMLRRTMKCDWMEPNSAEADQRPCILVMDAVLIRGGLTPDDCHSKQTEEKLKQRVQKVLGGVIKKIDDENRIRR